MPYLQEQAPNPADQLSVLHRARISAHRTASPERARTQPVGRLLKRADYPSSHCRSLEFVHCDFTHNGQWLYFLEYLVVEH